MQHSFDIEIATKHGVNAAIILNNIYFWVEKNKANNQHLHDGLYWTYNSVSAFSKLFPYMSSKQISTTLKKLEDDGLIKTGNYNKSTYDRTKWYALTKKAYCILQKVQMDIDETDEPIPDINADIKIINKKVIKVETPSGDCDAHNSFEDDFLSFPTVEKKSNVFADIVKAHGKDDADWALSIVSKHIDEHYPSVMGHKHPELNKSQRMGFARKFLDFVNLFELCEQTPASILRSIWHDDNIPDPTILIATDPKVLDYHALKIGCVDYQSLRHTEYCPVEDYY